MDFFSCWNKDKLLLKLVVQRTLKSFVPQIEPQPTRWQYPLINYLASKDKSLLQYKCDICDFSTSAQNGLSLHKRRLHKLDKNNEAVTQLDNPDFHNRDPKKYRHQCLRCTRRYKKIHHLERHQNKCDGIPPPTFKPMYELITCFHKFWIYQSTNLFREIFFNFSKGCWKV